MFAFLLLGREGHDVLRVASATDNGPCYYLLQSASLACPRSSRKSRTAFWKKGIDDLPEPWSTVVTNDSHLIVN
uniref:Uncharacterized protein n=1 Tax=Caenorhabditis japonica TaxID=281687 RepID=A0A8R1IZ33_CAEJA